MHYERLESRLDYLTLAMTSLTKRLIRVKKPDRLMEYKEESVHNVPIAARNAIVSMAKKVEDNILHVMTALVVMPPSICHTKDPRNQFPLGALPKVPNAVVIK